MMMKSYDQIYASLAGWGDRPVVIEAGNGKQETYISASHLKSQIDETIIFLKRAGIKKNFLVALFLKNSADFLAIYISLLHLGARPVPVNLAWRKIELDELFSNADPQGVIAERDHLAVIGKYLKNRIVLSRNKGKIKIYSSGKKAFKKDVLDFDDNIAALHYTYRGYGYPLGAMIPDAQYLNGAKALVEGLRPEPGENMLVILPFSYIFPLVGCLFVPLLYGVTIILSSVFNPAEIFKYIEKYRVNIVTAVPEVYELLFNLRDLASDLSSLRIFVSGGSVLSAGSYEKIKEAFGVDLLHGYGLTEFTPVSRNIRGLARAGTIGPVYSGIDCRVARMDDSGAGEILIRSEEMTKSYFRRERETREAFDKGWFLTGDLGRREDGHLVFLSEKKRVCKIRGNMVDLEEVRRALLMCPGMKNAEVYSREGVLNAGIDAPCRSFDRKVMDIKKYLENKIARYKIPKIINRME